ncbi:MAG: hypothetical protein BIFFINMI_04379 [Phycisphaerae bacterium]|nr:hypothetical protein [Phycisphaerae bacterium]
MRSNRVRIAALLAGAFLVGLVGGCAQTPQFNGQPVTVWQPAPGGDSPAPLFAPRWVAAPQPGVQQVVLPPMAWFNDRPEWPAPSGLSLGEVTYYRELYYDRQSSNVGSSRPIYDSFHRRFEIYRTGVMIR